VLELLDTMSAWEFSHWVAHFELDAMGRGDDVEEG
jgi:hypothetical protein